MTGRGVDQVLGHPGDDRIYESYMKSAKGYVQIAEEANGPIPHPVADAYIWGFALEELERMAPDARIINLETSITTSDDYLTGKGVHYRMHPANVGCITAASIDCCVLANNHVLDWGTAGLVDTIETLERVGIRYSGAGRNIEEAQKPAVLDIGDVGSVAVFSYGSPTSGVYANWAASASKPGIHVLPDLSVRSIRTIQRQVRTVKKANTVVVASIHWGDNWGFEIPPEQIAFAHALIDTAQVDVVHGHSSHHVKAVEVYRGHLILYGCGDLLNDYEGIRGHQSFRDDLGLLYFVQLDPESGKLVELVMIPTRIERFQLNRTSTEEMNWLMNVLNRDGRKFKTRVAAMPDGRLRLKRH